jgi:ferredoxin-type protein NapH
MKNKAYYLPIILLTTFTAVAVSLWLATGKAFYLFNFLYIGGVISLGVMMLMKGYKHARRFVQLGIGLYMLIYLGLLEGENMQLEGFFYYLFLGVFQAAAIHYFVAKIAGPFIFGRGWCGYACWTTMVLDFLPYQKPRHPRLKKLGMIRYILFAGSLVLVTILFLLKVKNLASVMVVLFVAGNLFYYMIGIALALVLKDNRAFCKYICPVTIFLKPASYFSLMRMKVDAAKCSHCQRCVKDCPMNVDLLDPSRSRENGTECILCFECLKACPQKAIHL